MTEIAKLKLRGVKPADWVRRKLPRELRVVIGREVLCYEADADAWILSLRGSKQ